MLGKMSTTHACDGRRNGNQERKVDDLAQVVPYFRATSTYPNVP